MEDTQTISEVAFMVNNLWILIAAFLVFMMHLGFATLEAGLTRAKNTVNILFKNTAIVSIGLLTYAFVGFNLMYPEWVDAWIPGVLGNMFAFGINPGETGQTSAYGDYTYYTDFIFQGMFAATAATIVSGAVAERVKLHSFLIFCAIYVAIIYPICGSWIWGSGWLAERGFHDFAGSTAVHAVGGWAALACALILGPRTGKYIKGESHAIFGHNLPLATIGAFLLWFGWYGFNGGSVLSADPNGVSLVFVTTSLGAAAGVIGSMITSWTVQKKPDHSMVLNGALAGLVSITAGADVITPMEAIIIGAIAGVIVVFSVFIFDKTFHVDDPVGATSVHLVCGVWGTIAAGIFGDYEGASIMMQIVGSVAIGVFCFTSAGIIFYTLKLLLGVRVSEEEEMTGLDVGEHGMEAYDGFQILVSR